jgi:hypothetical protein
MAGSDFGPPIDWITFAEKIALWKEMTSPAPSAGFQLSLMKKV